MFLIVSESFGVSGFEAIERISEVESWTKEVSIEGKKASGMFLLSWNLDTDGDEKVRKQREREIIESSKLINQERLGIKKAWSASLED